MKQPVEFSHLTRRTFGKLLGAASLWPLADGVYAALPTRPTHGLSRFGDLALPPDFTHFAYVNPDAPKGGTLRTMAVTSNLRTAAVSNQSLRSFDSFNMLILKGDTPAMMDIVHDTLMAPNRDEPGALYGLLAERVEPAADRPGLVFHLRPQARFHDNSPLTAEDCVFTFITLKAQGHPLITQYLDGLRWAEALGRHKLYLEFDSPNIQLYMHAARLPIISKAWYQTHDFDKTSLEPPLSCGPYRIADHRKDTFVSFERVKDYWGRDIPVNRGRFNFDTIRLVFFREPRP